MFNFRKKLTLAALVLSAACGGEKIKHEPQAYISKAAGGNEAEVHMMNAYRAIGTVETKFSFNGQVHSGVLSVSTHQDDAGYWADKVGGKRYWGAINTVDVEIRVPGANGLLLTTSSVIEADPNSTQGVSLHTYRTCVGQNNTCQRVYSTTPVDSLRDYLPRAAQVTADALSGRINLNSRQIGEVITAISVPKQ